jgi:hypothetical protein
MNGPVRCLVRLANGDLVAGGDFTLADGSPCNRIARWNGSVWSALGAGMDAPVRTLFVQGNGNLVAGGSFTTADAAPCNYIAVWDGTVWSPLGLGTNAEVAAISAVPNGDLVVGGQFTLAGGQPVDYVARWNGATWTSLGVGMDAPMLVLQSLPSGEIVSGGTFTTAGGNLCSFIALLTTTCPATSATFAAGCPSSGGPNLLTVSAQPWVDGVFRVQATGLPTTCFVVAVISMAPLIPSFALNSILPEAVPGCLLHVEPDILDPYITLTGAVEGQLFLPSTPPFVGAQFYYQMVPLEVDMSLAFVAITSTNALQLTVGAF